MSDLNMDVILQPFRDFEPIVMMLDASPWSIACVFGQLEKHLVEEKEGVEREQENEEELGEESSQEAVDVGQFVEKVVQEFDPQSG